MTYEGPSQPRGVLLTVSELQASYGHIPALRGVDLHVHAGEVVALLGANGAGKSTVLNVLGGVHEASGGRIELARRNVTRLDASDRVRAGLVLVPEGRQLFPSLTVRQNLQMGAYGGAAMSDWDESLRQVCEWFPALSGWDGRLAGDLSGGEQQIVALARALMSRPRLLLLDEPSLGLAPQLVGRVFKAIQSLSRDTGLAVLVADQNTKLALAVADRSYAMSLGRIRATEDSYFQSETRRVGAPG